jgi:hypothetical protein
MPLKPHPTDPDKMVYVKRKYRNPEETWDEPRTWVGLTDEEINSWEDMPMFFNMTTALEVVPTVAQFARFVEAKLRSKNT